MAAGQPNAVVAREIAALAIGGKGLPGIARRRHARQAALDQRPKRRPLDRARRCGAGGAQRPHFLGGDREIIKVRRRADCGEQDAARGNFGASWLGVGPRSLTRNDGVGLPARSSRPSEPDPLRARSAEAGTAALSPWPGLTRPSTSYPAIAACEDVDPRVRSAGGDRYNALQSNRNTAPHRRPHRARARGSFALPKNRLISGDGVAATGFASQFRGEAEGI
jgi:hypothetical protein